MKHFTKPSLFLILIVVLLIAACRKDSSIITETPIFPNPTVLIETGAKGMVADEDGKPIEGATIKLGDEVTTSNEYGYYEISGKTNAAQPFVRIEKSGYFPSICNFTGRAGKYGRLKSILRTKTLSGRIQAVNGGEVQVSGGGSIEFKSGGFVNSSGQSYNGDVNVYATYLDPTKPETMQMIPGSFRGTNLEGEDQVLVSYGMMNVLLESPSGEKLQINKPATLTTPIPAEKLSSAPSSIPLWYINEATSIWMEEGSATKQGNTFVGEVSHFSRWNCDVGFPVVTLSGRVVIDGKSPFVILQVTISNGQQTSSNPDSEGYFSGGVPANETFLFEVIDECNEVVYSSNLGPFSIDTEIGNISVNINSTWSMISGTLKNCDGEPVTNGIVFITGATAVTSLFPIVVNSVDGTFSSIVRACTDSEIIVRGYDLTNMNVSNQSSQAFASAIDFGVIYVCNSSVVDLEISIEYGGQTKKLQGISFYAHPTAMYYTILAFDKQGENTALYQIGILNWSYPDPELPDSWQYTVEVSLTGNPEYFDFEYGQITALHKGLQSGELLHLEIKNPTLMRYPGGTSIPDAKITIIGVIP
ncbi:MAG: hypothetical protein IPI60_07565 [Saprospiraceae bacterium]|nr:hypothetical protein [Saprospiraceae bacterium]